MHLNHQVLKIKNPDLFNQFISQQCYLYADSKRVFWEGAYQHHNNWERAPKSLEIYSTTTLQDWYLQDIGAHRPHSKNALQASDRAVVVPPIISSYLPIFLHMVFLGMKN